MYEKYEKSNRYDSDELQGSQFLGWAERGGSHSVPDLLNIESISFTTVPLKTASVYRRDMGFKYFWKALIFSGSVMNPSAEALQNVFPRGWTGR